MATVRMQVIQRFLIDKKFEEAPSPTQKILEKILETVRSTPIIGKISGSSRSQPTSVMRTRECKKVDVKAELSPVRNCKLSATQSSQNFFKGKKKGLGPEISTCGSLDLIKPNKSILETKLRTTQVKVSSKSPRKNLKNGRGGDYKPLEIMKVGTKSEVDKLWRKVINPTNGIEVYQSPFVTYNVYVGKGNNSQLIKKIMSKRSWWKLTDVPENAHFTWFQWKNKKLLEGFKSCTSTPSLKIDQSPAPWPPINKVLLPKIRSPNSENFGLALLASSSSYTVLNSEKFPAENQKLHNRLEFNNILTNKKGLYHTLKTYNEITKDSLFSKIPLTFNISSESDPEYSNFLACFSELENQKSSSFQNTWIIKPGENTNRGNGILVCNTLESIKEALKPVENKSYIIQKYLESPLLINKRKFDIRCYVMITSINGVIQGYFYLDGYLRTASHEFTIDDVSNLFIHLTNDAIQKHSADYGKYENGNKLSYRSFQRYLELNHPEVNFFTQILPKIRDIIKETILASFMFIDKNKRMHCMEVFGYDFMIDSEFKPWLIEVNTNPCLETSSPYLKTIIPAMIENAFKIVVDSVFPPQTGSFVEDIVVNRFELIFHQEKEGKELLKSLVGLDEGIPI